MSQQEIRHLKSWLTDEVAKTERNIARYIENFSEKLQWLSL